MPPELCNDAAWMKRMANMSCHVRRRRRLCGPGCQLLQLPPLHDRQEPSSGPPGTLGQEGRAPLSLHGVAGGGSWTTRRPCMLLLERALCTVIHTNREPGHAQSCFAYCLVRPKGVSHLFDISIVPPRPVLLLLSGSVLQSLCEGAGLHCAHLGRSLRGASLLGR